MTAPLEYESLKIVIQYLDPNLRFQLAQRIPSIRLTEKAVPLKLKTLTFSENTITINDISYRVGVYRDYPQQSPFNQCAENNKGGASYDLGQYGTVDFSGENVVTPGDLALPALLAAPIMIPNEEWEEPEFTPKLQLSLKSADDEQFRQIYRYEYTMKLHEALKNLSSRLLGDRRHPIKVEKLDMSRMNLKVIRLPIGLKITTQNLYIYARLLNNYAFLSPYLDKSSFPLNTLSIEDSVHSFTNCDHDVFRNARRLIVGGLSRPDHENYSTLFMQFRNPCVEILGCLMDFPVADQINLIRDWRDNGRPVGTYFSYKVRQDASIEDLLDQIRRELDGIVTGNRLATIPLSIDNCITVECCEDDVRQLDLLNVAAKWTVKLRVVIRQDN